MSIVPACLLSRADLALLGNNLRPPVMCRRPNRSPHSGRNLAAVNRSLAPHGERVDRLDPPGPASPVRRCAAPA